MKMNDKEYAAYAQKHTPNSPTGKNCIWAFLTGGIICVIGQLIRTAYLFAGLTETDASSATSATLVFLGVFLTAVGVYDKIAKHAGAGTLVPITGFANAVASPAVEFRTEGIVTGTAVKMFTIAGPVIVFGTVAGVVYGIVLVIAGAV